MSKNEPSTTSAFSKFDQMSTQQLQEILRQFSQLPEIDGAILDMILYITNILAKREETDPKEVDAAWESFQADYLPSTPMELQPTKKRQRKGLRRLSLIAATVAVLFACVMVVQAAGVDVFGTLASWTNSHLRFGEGTSTPLEASQLTDSLEQEIRQALIDLQLSETMYPTWIPEEYTLAFYNPVDLEWGKSLFVSYGNDTEDDIISVGIGQYTDPEVTKNMIFEKDDTEPEPYAVNGRTFIIYTNSGDWCAAWADDLHSISISGLEDKADLIRMLDSIPG